MLTGLGHLRVNIQAACKGTIGFEPGIRTHIYATLEARPTMQLNYCLRAPHGCMFAYLYCSTGRHAAIAKKTKLGVDPIKSTRPHC